MAILKLLLAERNLTTSQLAKKAGVKKRTLDPYVSGKANLRNARGELLIAVADALEIDPHILVNGEIQINLKSTKRDSLSE